MKLILAAIVLALLWRSRRKSEDAIDNALLRAAIRRRAGRSLDSYRRLEEGDDEVLPVDPYTWTMA